MNYLINFLNVLKLIERLLIFLCTSSMISLYGFNVIIREFFPLFASTFAWIDEASRILMVWMVFLSLGLALDKGRHISMSTFLDSIKKKPKIYLNYFISFVGFCFSLYLIYLALNLSIFVFKTGQVSPTLNIPMFYLYLAPTFGFTLLSIRYLINILNILNFNKLLNIIGN